MCVAALAACGEKPREEPKTHFTLPPVHVRQEYVVLEKSWGGRTPASAYCTLVLRDKQEKRYVTTVELGHYVQETVNGPWVPTIKANSPCSVAVGERVLL